MIRFFYALLLLPLAQAQQPQPIPHAGYVYPAGGRQGATLEVTVGGQALIGVDNVYLSGPGVHVRVLEYERPMTPAEANTLREQAQELNKKRQANPAAFPPGDAQKLLEIRDKLAKFVRRPQNSAIAETVRLEVAIDPAANPGDRELRLATPQGITNPLVFQIGTLPEWTRKIAEASTAPRRRVSGANFQHHRHVPRGPDPAHRRQRSDHARRHRPLSFLRHQGSASRRRRHRARTHPLHLRCRPRLVSGTLALRDSTGKELDYADHYTFHPDPVLYYEIPADGQYTIEIKDSIYRGREDFVYRIALGELPFVTSIFPLGGKAGARTTVQLKGWNLSASRLTEAVKIKGITPVSVPNSNSVPFAVDTIPEALEKDSNGQPRNAQKLKLPVIVNGRIDRPDEWDVFRFEGKAGDEIVAEVMARRLDSPLDSIPRLTDAKGRELAVNDDTEDQSAALLTHHADSRIILKLPANGTYYLYLGDTQHHGGPEYAYRLRVSHPQPDFELRVTPSGINARSGATVPITVHAIRRDGFMGEITVKLKDAPAGFSLDGAVVPAGQDKVRMTLTAPLILIESPHKLNFEGYAEVAGRDLHHTAIAAEDMMQAFYFHHLVAVSEVVVRVMGPARPPVVWKPFGERPVRVPAGATTAVQIAVPNPRLNGQIQLKLDEPPEGITIQSVTPARDGVSVLVSKPTRPKSSPE